MQRWIVIVIVVALVGGGAYWFFQREAAKSRASEQQELQEPQEQRSGGPLQRGEGGGSGPARGDDKVVGLGPRGQAPDERHPRHHTAQQLRADPVRAAGRHQELIQYIRKAGEEPGGAASEGDEGKAVLGKKQIRAAIKAISPLVRTCYEKRLAQKEDLAGKAVIKFTIVAKDGKGSLDEGEIKSSTLGDLRLDTCMLHALTKARFPLPKGEGKVTVHYPFKFRPRSK